MKKSYQIVLHIAFWLVFNVLQYIRYISLNYEDISSAFYLMIGIQIILNLITFYGAYFIVFTNFFNNSKLRSFSFFILYVLANIIFRTYFSRYVFSFVEKETWLDKYNSIWLQTLFVFTYIGLSFLIRFTIQWFHDQQIKAELINQKQASELAFLRAQVNPHFLFNTLNNIYSLALQKSDNVAVSIARLSDIMRYMLKDSNKEKVPLEKELEYLQSFIVLQRLRIEYDNFIQFKIKGDISNKKIAPMLLIPFVENAFKHGSKKVNLPGVIINIEIEKKLLKLTVLNFMKEKKNETEDDLQGNGLYNVKKRLGLIYKDRYILKINEDTHRNQFEVFLTIEL